MLASFRHPGFFPPHPFTTVDLSAAVNNNSLDWTHSLRAQGEVSPVIRHTVGSLLFKKEKKTCANCGCCLICTDLRVSLRHAHGHVSGNTWWCMRSTSASARRHGRPSVLIRTWVKSLEGTLEANHVLPPPCISVCFFFPFILFCLFVYLRIQKTSILPDICNKHGKVAGTLIWGQRRPRCREMRWQPWGIV